MINDVSKVITNVRNTTPLIHAITNYVTINDCANILLSYGASPAMAEAYDETYDFASISSALYINIGTLTKEQEQAIIMAVISAKNNNIPVVLDPVACGAIKRKMDVINRIFQLGKVDIIKGNLGEIKYLAGYESKSRGVDSIDDGNNSVEACESLALKYNCTVIATGAEDIVTDGKRTAIITNGTKLLTLITGAGCMVGALTAATAAAEKDKFVAGIASVLAMNLAGEHAEKHAKAPGSFRVKLIDEIYNLKEEDFLKEGNITWL